LYENVLHIMGIRYTVVIIFCTTACVFSADHQTSVPVSVSAGNRDTINLPVIEFEETRHDFGRVYEGEQVGWFFKFRNTGSVDLLINNAYSSCGCTVPDYNKTPVSAGGTGMVKVIFDTKGRTGMQTKTVTIESNARNKMVALTITAEIKRKNKSN